MHITSGSTLALPLLLILGACTGAPGPAPGEDVATRPGAQPRQSVEEAGLAALPPDGHTSRIALDWAGTYSGVLPCASCPGIETTVTLYLDGRYERERRYIDGDPIPQVSSGRFSWDEAGRSVMLEEEGEEAQQYQVGEDLLFLLDHAGRRVEGELGRQPHPVPSPHGHHDDGVPGQEPGGAVSGNAGHGR